MSLDEVSLVTAHRRGQSRWPKLALAFDTFRHYASRQVLGSGALEHYSEELYLAWACGQRIAGAVEQFEQDYMSKALTAARRYDNSPDFRNEVAQRVRNRLFLGESPKILTYSGSGPLLAWLRIAVTRDALDLLEAGKRTKPLGQEMADRLLTDSATPESRLVEATYHPTVQAAVETCLTQLSPRDRTILRLHFVDGANIEQIGAMYRVHRATVARWIVSLREQLLSKVHESLEGTHSLSKSEVRSLWRLARHKIDVSVARILASDPGDGGNG